MIHLGDITKINGAEIPVVDCITGGSPCQGLSVAGKRAGLKDERSGLFMEQVRIVREMRERDRARGRTGYMVRPRYMVWENVPGAFSSARGADFATVLEEIIKVCEPGADVRVDVPDKGWTKFGCYYAENGAWSVAWRVHDAQFWGVPQRRKRIALVADFGGLSAPEVLFERKGLRRDIDESEPQREEAAGGTGEGAAGTSWCIKGNAIDRDTAQNRVTDYTALCVGNGQLNQISMAELANTLDTMHDQQAVYVPAVAHSPKAKGNCDFRENSETYISRVTTIRRLTPLEYERLQGYPDGWTDIGEWTDRKGKKKQTTDTARYKALGNSIALPFWFWLLRRISAQYERPATLGSLFDGIGGFPLCWERCNGKGTAIWASEIEEFPIAVTKRRLGDG